MGYAIDFLVLLFVIWSLWRGWRHGFLFQLGQIALLIVCYFAARGLGALLRDPIADAGADPDLASTIGFIGVFLILYIVGAILLRKLTRDLTSFSEGLTTTDRTLGLIIGGAKGLFLAYVAIVSMVMIHRMTGKLPIPFADSFTGRWAIAHNFFDTDDRMRALTKLVCLMQRRDATDVQDPHIQAILAHPKAQVLLEPEIVEAAADRDLITLVSSPEVWDFLSDPDIQAHLEAVDCELSGG